MAQATFTTSHQTDNNTRCAPATSLDSAGLRKLSKAEVEQRLRLGAKIIRSIESIRKDMRSKTKHRRTGVMLRCRMMTTLYEHSQENRHTWNSRLYTAMQ